MATTAGPQALLARSRRGRATAPFLVLLAAGCAAAFLAFLALLNALGHFATVGGRALPAHAYMDLLGLAFVAFGAPYGFLEWREGKRVQEIEARLPDFLSDLASLHKAGLTLMDAIATAARGSYGALTPEVRHAAAQVAWGVPVLDALGMLRDRLATPLADRTLTVVIEAGRSGGNVKDVLMVAADIARRLAVMRADRRREMSLYLVIVYVASLVFLFVVLALQGVFVPKMVAAVNGVGAGGAALGVGGAPSAADFRGLYVAAALVQAVGNGVVSGMMSDGRLSTGVKHSAAMTAISLAGFALFA